MPELLVILAVALVVLGPQRLPELARSLGRAMSELRRASGDIKEELRSLETQIEDGRDQDPPVSQSLETSIQEGPRTVGEKTG
jgi:Tat protein translocase TatB subunit